MKPRAGFIQCVVCSVVEPEATSEHHHKVPRAFGGPDTPENMAWLCGACHTRLHRVHGRLVAGKTAAAYELTSAIFPYQDGPRMTLWELANIAADAEKDAKTNFAEHRTTTKVSLTLDADTWSGVKAAAKNRGVSVSVLVQHALETVYGQTARQRGRGELQEGPGAPHLGADGPEGPPHLAG